MKAKLLLITIVINYLFKASLSAQCVSPVISSFAPLSAAAGATITINGNNFDPTPSNNIVFLGAAKATIQTSSPTQLTIIVPVGATYNHITVTNSVCGLTAYSPLYFNPVSVCPGTFNASTVDTRIDYTSADPNYGPYAVLFGDFDLDGKTDVLYPTAFGNTAGLVITRNQSVPGIIDLSSALTIITGNVRNCAIADFDRDSKLDIVYVDNNSSRVNILRNTSSGPGNFSFASPIALVTNSSPYQVAADDIDGDGRPDIAVSHFGSINLAIYRNTSATGSISFNAKQDFNSGGSAQYGVGLADLDGDNKVELISTLTSNNLSVLRNTSVAGAISFSSFQIFTGSVGYRLAIGDLNDDGKNDVVSANLGANGITSYRNTSVVGTISFAASTVLATSHVNYRVSISDLNGDGRPDIVCCYNGSTIISCLLNTSTASGAITVGAEINLNNSGCAYALGTADIDGDGNNDVITGDWCQNRKLNVFRNNVLGQIPVTNSVTPTTGLTCNSTITINYLAQCFGANPGNVYTAQLSDASGSFAVPINIGSVNSATSGTITGIIPACIATGTGYRVRVVGSDPATTGTVYGTPLSITCQTITPASITTSSINPTTYCAGATVNVGYTATGSFGVCGTNTFTAQLSDASGSFASAVNIGSVVSNTSGTISGTIPANTPAGNSYRIRVISDQPQKVGTNNGSNITIGGIAPSIVCPGNISMTAAVGECSAIVNFTATGTGTITYSMTPGSSFPVGQTLVTATSTTDCGSMNCTFTVTVSAPVPELDCPDDIEVSSPLNQCSAIVNYTAPQTLASCCPTPSSISGYTLLGNYNGHRYFISNGGFTWSAAKAAAISHGGHLVTIGSVGENNFLSSHTSVGAWIGFTDEAVEGTWKWITDEPVTFTAWAGGEPNDAGGIEDHALTNWGLGSWNDLVGTNTIPYILEFECDGSGSYSVTQTAGLPSGSSFPLGTTTNAFSITDGNGATTTCSFTVTVTDNQAPVITCPLIGNTNRYTNAGVCSYKAVQTEFDATATDNCTVTSLTYTLSGVTTGTGTTLAGVIFNKGVTTVTWAATDGSSTTATCSFTVTVSDNEVPVFGSGNNSNGDIVYLRSSVSAPWVSKTGNEVAMDAVFGTGVWKDWRFETVNTATLFSSATRFIFMEGGDNNANELKAFILANKTQMENWVSNGGKLLLNAAPNEGGNIDFGFGGVTLVYPNGTSTAVATVPTHPIFNGPLTPVGTTWTGSSFGHAIVTPANASMIKLIHNSSNNLALLVEAQWGNGRVMFGGMTLPWFQDTYCCGLWAQPMTGNLHKNILSYLASTGTNQGNITVASVSGQCGAVVTFNTPSATDNCPGLQISQSQGLPSGSTFPVGTTTNIFIATDGDGNTATYSFTVTVTDAQAPVITQPNNITTGNDPGNCSALVSFSAQVTDNCAVSSIKYYLNYNTPNQEEIFFPKTFAVGSYIVTVVAKDAADNTTTKQFTITVDDTEKPTVTKGTIEPCFKTVALAEAAALEATTYSDNCSSSEELDVTVSTTGTCSAEITVTVTDASNNSKSVTYNTKIDNTAPVLSLMPSNTTVNCQSIPSVPTVTANDNCDGAVNVVFTTSNTQGSDPAASNYYNYTITRTWSASDGCGNTVTYSQTITVQDITAPVITCPTDKLQIPFDFGQLYATIAVGNATATDNCASSSNITIAGTRSDNVAFTNQQYPLGTTTVSWSATDPSSNSSACTQTITVRKRNTSLTYTGIMTNNMIIVQYSDIIYLQANLTDNEGLPTPNNISGRTITFQLLSGTTVLRSKIATTNANGIAADTFKIEQAPGLYKVKTIFAGDSYFDNSYDLDDCEVKQEDAIVEYNGSQYFTTASATTMNGSVTLAAAINDIDDGNDKRGDIRKAKATFKDGGSSGNVLGSANLPVGLINPGVLTNGLSATTHNYSLNSNEASSGGKIFQVWVGVNDHYTGADAGPTPVTLALPGQDFVTGGGHLVLTNSAGTYAGTANSKMNFGFTMKWNKSGKNLQGNVNIVFRKWQLYNNIWQWRVYQIKSNAINSMAVVEVGSNGQPASATNPAVFRKAIINTKANLKDVTDPLANVDYGGNHNLVLEALDHITANGGVSDKISVMLMGSTTNELLFSSSWVSNATATQTITGGNINVRNGSGTSSGAKNTNTSTAEMENKPIEQKVIFSVKAYPNPSEHQFTIVVNSNSNEAVQIQLYDALGRLVETIYARANEATRFGEKLKTGIYVAKVIQESKTETMKLIKQ